MSLTSFSNRDGKKRNVMLCPACARLFATRKKKNGKQDCVCKLSFSHSRILTCASKKQINQII